MQKKVSTPRTRAAKQPTRAELRAKLARDIASILSNPETPATFYNSIADEMTAWQNVRDNDLQNGWRSVGFIENCLDAYQRSEEKRRREVRSNG